MAEIPDALSGDGKNACEEIGEDVFARWGIKGMIKVFEYYRDNLDEKFYQSESPDSCRISAAIDRAWDGIGGWMS